VKARFIRCPAVTELVERPIYAASDIDSEFSTKERKVFDQSIYYDESLMVGLLDYYEAYPVQVIRHKNPTMDTLVRNLNRTEIVEDTRG